MAQVTIDEEGLTKGSKGSVVLIAGREVLFSYGHYLWSIIMWSMVMFAEHII